MFNKFIRPDMLKTNPTLTLCQWLTTVLTNCKQTQKYLYYILEVKRTYFVMI